MNIFIKNLKDTVMGFSSLIDAHSLGVLCGVLAITGLVLLAMIVILNFIASIALLFR